ncbi:MAG TPA: chemotaxis protein CheB [Longimicrobiales bacterium]|nr:chemotaxis protein CheB [Longimicrobiales bacterium]
MAPTIGFPIVAVAASAGGLDALRTLLAEIPADFGAPILIVQHMSQGHTTHLAEILGRYCDLPVSLARDGDRLEPGHVFVAPPGHHLLLGSGGETVLSGGAPVNFCRPSADRLFESLASAAGANAIAVVLTGTGRDGAAGLLIVKQGGGTTIVQSEQTSLHKGMPHAAMESGPDFVVPLDAIAGTLLRLVKAAA